jgi:hypothetical protein
MAAKKSITSSTPALPPATTSTPTPASTKPAAKPASRRKAAPASLAAGLVADPAVDPTTDAALLALSARHAASPDIPVSVAVNEIASLARLARGEQTRFTAIGLGPDRIAALALFGRRLAELEAAWGSARSGVKLTAAQKKLRAEAEALDPKLLAGGRWACRKDAEAQEELTRIAEGSSLADTIQDLRDLVIFWSDHKDDLGSTDITAKDLARASALADALDAAAATEAANLDAARALDLRNRAFWASDELAREIREGGRYAFRGEPLIAAKFISRYRAAAAKRTRRKSKAAPAPAPTP